MILGTAGLDRDMPRRGDLGFQPFQLLQQRAGEGPAGELEQLQR